MPEKNTPSAEAQEQAVQDIVAQINKAQPLNPAQARAVALAALSGGDLSQKWEISALP